MQSIPVGRRWRAVLISSALAASVAIAAPATAQDLTIGVRAGPLAIDPHFSSVGQHASAARNMFDALVRRGPDMELLPALAKSWRLIDDTTWEIALRSDVQWHGGARFTAHDVKFSIERIPTLNIPTGSLVAYVKFIKSAVVVDDHTIRLLTDGPAPSLMAEIERVFIVQERAARGADNATFRTGGAAIGTGPYRYVSWEPRGDLVLERNDHYWGDTKPHWRRVTFREIGNDSARVAALLSGGVDAINYVPSTSVTTLQRTPNLAVAIAPSLYVFLLHPDGRETTPQAFDLEGRPLERNPFRDLRVRRALSLAINRQAIARSVMEGLANPADTPMPPQFFGVPKNVAPLAFDPAEARRLLAEAGFPRGFRVQLNCTNDRFANDARVCAALGAMLTQVGITTEVQALPTSVYLTAFSRGDFSLSMNGWGTLTGEAIYMLASLIHTRGADPTFGTFNRMRYSNPAIDAVTRQAIATMNQDARQALLERGMRMVMDDNAIIPVVGMSSVWATNARRVTYVARMDEETLAVDMRPVSP